MKAIITVGISGSGKSTWAENLIRTDGDNNTWVNINRDETRWLLSGYRGWNGPTKYNFNSIVETCVTVHNNQMLIEAADAGFDVIISDTNLNSKFRNKLIAQLTELGYEVEIKEFPISFQEACKRDAQRGIYSVGEAVLMKQWESWIKYHEEKGGGMW